MPHKLLGEMALNLQTGFPSHKPSKTFESVAAFAHQHSPGLEQCCKGVMLRVSHLLGLSTQSVEPGLKLGSKSGLNLAQGESLSMHINLRERPNTTW